MEVRKRTKSCQIAVGDIPPGVTAKELGDFFNENTGVVCRCKIKGMYFKEGDWRSQGYGFVDFLTRVVAEYAQEQAEEGKLIIRGTPLKVRVGGFQRHPPLFLPKIKLGIGFRSAFTEIKLCWSSAPQGVTAEFNFSEKRVWLIIKEGQFPSEEIFSYNPNSKFTEYRLDFPMRDLHFIECENEYELFLTSATPPRVFFRLVADDIWELAFHPPKWYADDEDLWIRTVDFTELSCLGYSNVFVLSTYKSHRLDVAYIKQQMKEFHMQDSFFEMKNLTVSDFSYYPQPGVHLKPFFTLPKREGIPFDVTFLLNGCVQRYSIPPTSLTDRFYEVLSKDISTSRQVLRYMMFGSHPNFNPIPRFRKLYESMAKDGRLQRAIRKEENLPENHMLIRRMVITPSSALCMPSEIELSNRVLRQYSEFSDRFLRVVFMDEGQANLSSWVLLEPQALIHRERRSDTRTLIYFRILNIVEGGFDFAGLHFEYLAASASQLREKSAWFFAPDPERGVTIKGIQAWMGNFSSIRNVAKCASRMGQCFSSSFYTKYVPRECVENIPDVIDDKDHCFTDGIGKISPDFALEIAHGLVSFMDQSTIPILVPSAFQIRYAGYKGVVAQWPAPKGSQKKLFFRKSMHKFESQHCELDIVGWTRFMPCYLNRQIITLLSTLGVPDSVFIELQKTMVNRLDKAMYNANIAMELLKSTCAEDLHHTAISMLEAGFSPSDEPHLRGMMLAFRSLQLQELLVKSRIFVPKGRWLMGVVDETATLQYGQCFVRVSGPMGDSSSGPFSEFSLGRQRSRVVTGRICFGKNPCLHPGDLRMLTAVDNPKLRHLVDCVVLPQRGHRPHANEASGSDLDGDVYFVTWDERLVPLASEAPMHYGSAKPEVKSTPVTPKDIHRFFVNHMLNDSVGVICNAHVVHADMSDQGAKDPNCITLAMEAVKAFDFVKTGIPGVMPPSLRVMSYPDFMEKEETETYRSDKILGVLYRWVKGVVDSDIVKALEPSDLRDEVYPMHGRFPHVDDVIRAFDPNLLVRGYHDHVKEAWKWKMQYDIQLLNLMDQYGVRMEGEIVTDNIVNLSRYYLKRQGTAKEKIKIAYMALHARFRDIFLLGHERGEKKIYFELEGMVDSDTASKKKEEKSKKKKHKTVKSKNSKPSESQHSKMNRNKENVLNKNVIENSNAGDDGLKSNGELNKAELSSSATGNDFGYIHSNYEPNKAMILHEEGENHLHSNGFELNPSNENVIPNLHHPEPPPVLKPNFETLQAPNFNFTAEATTLGSNMFPEPSIPFEAVRNRDCEPEVCTNLSFHLKSITSPKAQRQPNLTADSNFRLVSGLHPNPVPPVGKSKIDDSNLLSKMNKLNSFPLSQGQNLHRNGGKSNPFSSINMLEYNRTEYSLKHEQPSLKTSEEIHDENGNNNGIHEIHGKNMDTINNLVAYSDAFEKISTHDNNGDAVDDASCESDESDDSDDNEDGNTEENTSHIINMTKLLKKQVQIVDENLVQADRNVLKAKASAWYYVTYHQEFVEHYRQKEEKEGEEKEALELRGPLLSFAWIAADFLKEIRLESKE